MALSTEQQLELQAQLETAVVALNERCLYSAAKWVAELLNSFAHDDSHGPETNNEHDQHDTHEENRATTQSNSNLEEARLEKRERSRFLLAKSLFDCREYDRCAAVFLPICQPHSGASALATDHGPDQMSSGGSSQSFKVPPKRATPARTPAYHNLSQKALFLALYSRYLAGEKRKHEDSEPMLGPNDGGSSNNKELSGIVIILTDYFNLRGALEDRSNSDGWLDYLFGLVLLRSKSEALAKQWLLRSVNANPWNWSAWLELASVANSQEELSQIGQHLPQNIMTFFFHIHCSQELFQQNEQAFNTLTQMLEIFPNSAFLHQQKAIMHYHAREHELAVQTFDGLIRDHPHRLEGLEAYSNLLYVLPNRPKLATLASRASSTDKFRPETNCVLGNYYSLISEHEKAVLHFRRALILDRSFQVAWTLMGHEYIELKNTQAAIESYRRAVDINRKDYRAWYGLGQGYEMLECYSYSLFYYQRAASLCPGDPKLWSAVGNAYGKCNKTGNAIQAYKRALVVGSQIDLSANLENSDSDSDPLTRAVGGVLDPQTLYDIALLYESDGNLEEAAAYMELALAQEEGTDDGEEGMGVTQITSRARLWLARWCYSIGEWQRTMDLANELCQDGIEVEEAKSLVKDVRARLSLLEGMKHELDRPWNE